MSNPDEPYYCSQQINIPPELPDILKQFTKAAIRTQPKDVLAWSAAYFRSMANGEMPPVKDRLEMPTATQKTDTGLTPGLLRILHKQVKINTRKKGCKDTNTRTILKYIKSKLQVFCSFEIVTCLEAG